MDDGGGFRKARMELEALYEGVPDDSVNLTFRHLTDINLQPNSSLEKKRGNNPSIKIPIPRDNQTTPLTKLPSLDFNRGLQAANQYSRPDAKISLHPSAQVGGSGTGSGGLPHAAAGDIQSFHPKSEHEHVGGLRPALEYSAAYEEASRISSMYQHQHQRATPGRRRPGIPHSKICTNCSTYIYIFRHRCLVCGRVYCRECVRIGMGEMTEGRKCIECLGRKFSHRYIGKAGDVGCFGWRYSNAVKQAELKWAEKGPRRKGERGYGGGGGGRTNSMSMMSASQSPSPWPSTTTTSVDVSTIYSSRFAVMSSPHHSPAHRHHIPF